MHMYIYIYVYMYKYMSNTYANSYISACVYLRMRWHSHYLQPRSPPSLAAVGSRSDHPHRRHFDGIAWPGIFRWALYSDSNTVVDILHVLNILHVQLIFKRPPLTPYPWRPGGTGVCHFLNLQSSLRRAPATSRAAGHHSNYRLGICFCNHG